MKEEQIAEIVKNLARPLLAGMGLELWGLEIVPQGRSVVRLYVELPAGSLPADRSQAALDAAGELAASPDIDQCEEISRQLGLALDVEDCMPGPWELEVSTPGLSRRFFSAEQMRPFVGDVVELRLHRDQAGEGERRSYCGILRGVDGDVISLEPCAVDEDGQVRSEGQALVELDWKQVERARRRYVFVTPARPGKTKAASRGAPGRSASGRRRKNES